MRHIRCGRELSVGRLSILIGTLLSLAAWSAQAATSSTLVDVRLVVVDSCDVAVQPSAQGGTHVACDRGTPYRIEPAPAEAQAALPTQVQTDGAGAARTVTITY